MGLNPRIVVARKRLAAARLWCAQAKDSHDHVVESVQEACRHVWKFEGQDNVFGQKTFTRNFECLRCEKTRQHDGPPLCPSCEGKLLLVNQGDHGARSRVGYLERRRFKSLCGDNCTLLAYRCKGCKVRGRSRLVVLQHYHEPMRA